MQLKQLSIEVDKTADISHAIYQIRQMCSNKHLAEIDLTELLTLCSEIINNIQKHTVGGSIHIRYSDGTFEIKAMDHGKGITDIKMALKEGYSTAGSLGLGIPAIVRLCDELFITTSAEGTNIHCTRLPKC